VNQSVLVGMMLPGFVGMVAGVQRVSMGDVGVVPGLLVIARVVVFGRFAMMCGGVFVMFGGLQMMFRSVMSHSWWCLQPAVYLCNLRIR
jgi:hypothetical protein